MAHADAKYTAIGDSLTFGDGASTPSNNFVNRIKAKLDVDYAAMGPWTLQNRGISGERITQVQPSPLMDATFSTQIDQAIADNPQLITVTVGGNDVIGSVQVGVFQPLLAETAPQFKARIKPLYADLLLRLHSGTAADIVIANVADVSRTPLAQQPPFTQAHRDEASAKVIAANAAITEAISEGGYSARVRVADLYGGSNYDPAYFSADNFHPNDAGYALVAAEFSRQINGLLDTAQGSAALVVNNNSDVNDGTCGTVDCSLREAMVAANANVDATAISFDLAGTGPHTIQLAAALPDLNSNMSIEATAGEPVTLRGQGTTNKYRILNIVAGVVSISNFTLTNGRSVTGGGGIENSGVLTLNGCTISGNTAEGNTGGGIRNWNSLTMTGCTVSNNTVVAAVDTYGPGIFNLGSTLNLYGCTVSNNTASSSGVSFGGGLGSTTTVTLQNCTFSGNSVSGPGGGRGGGIYLDPTNSVITNCTFVNNSASHSGGGMQLFGPNTTVNNSIVAGNSATIGPNIDGAFIGSFNITSGNPMVGPLANNGGPTQTHALFYGSPAIDAGDTSLTTDQRGVARPHGSADDIGALEATPSFSISGYVRSGNVAPVAGVSVQLQAASGPVGAPVLTDANGFYTFSNIYSGGYLVTPTLAGWTFAPTAQSLVVNNASRGANFIATRTVASYNISGRISSRTGQALVGVSVALTPTTGGVATPVATNSAGYYTFSNVPDGSYTITPTRAGSVFFPGSYTVTVAGSSISGRNFVDSTGHTVSGRIATSSGIGISGVTVTLDGGTTVTSNSAGYYTFYNVANGAHDIVPTKAGYTFTPATKSVLVNGTNLSAQNFVGTGP